LETAMPSSYADGYEDGDAIQLRRCRGYATMLCKKLDVCEMKSTGFSA
jgi:hypothetical protein